jgi:hypothetical protein
MIDLQEWGNDTITHLISSESKFPYNPPACPVSCGGMTPLLYFRKMTFGNAGTWIGPTVLDTVAIMGHVTASRTTPKVAVIYIQYPATAYANNNGDDEIVVYRESDSVGVTWKPKVNITNYNQMTGPSYTAWVEAKGLYDSNGKLHIIFNGIPVPKDPYGTGFVWNSLLNGSSVLHWSNATNAISRIYNAEFDFDTYDYPSVFCGFIGTNMLTSGNFAMSECDGNLYVVWVMGNNPNANPPLLNDCATGGTRDARYKANGEIYLSVSSDLDGLLWDAARDITNTPTPGCDSAGFGGICYSDVKPTMSDFGMDITSFDTNAVPVTLTWPDAGVVPGPGPYSGNYYTHIFYVEDQYPDQKAINPTDPAAGKWTNNPLKWMRLACVSPISAPQIAYTPTGFGYPDWTKHAKPDTTIITVTNDGNATLSVTTIGIKKTTQTGVDWLGTTASSLSISAGTSNTATFGVIVNKGVVGSGFTPGTIVALTGEVWLKSNAVAPRDSVTVKITNFIVADTLVGLKWDTVTTGCTRLIVSNNGDVGRLGQGTVNMDYYALGGECDSVATNQKYLYDGGPIVIRKSGSNYIYSNALFQGNFTTEQAFKPFAQGAGASSIAGSGYDGFYTGTFVNRDTTVGVRRTYYAPTVGSDTCNFIIQKSVFFGLGGPKTNVTLGEVIDWDIPTYGTGASASNNDGRVMTSKNIVYQQGLDTGTVLTNTRCIRRDKRFGSIAFLGMYTPAEKLADTCANDVNMYGAYVMLNDTLFKYDTLTNTNEGAYFWNQMGALSGLTAAPFQSKDMHMVMTYKHDVTSLDTLTVYSAVVSVKNGDTSALKTGVDKAAKWYFDHLRPGCGSCCLAMSDDGRTGNVDEVLGSGVDISDVSALISFLYIPPYVSPVCVELANCDGDWSPGWGIDISDISAMISRLYIPPYAALGLCQ